MSSMGYPQKRIHIYLMATSWIGVPFLWRSYSHCLHLNACPPQVSLLALPYFCSCSLASLTKNLDYNDVIKRIIFPFLFTSLLDQLKRQNLLFFIMNCYLDLVSHNQVCELISFCWYFMDYDFLFCFRHY